MAARLHVIGPDEGHGDDHDHDHDDVPDDGHAGPAAAAAVQQVLEVDVAGGEEVGGRGVEHRRELEDRRPVLREHGARDGGAESLNKVTLLTNLPQ